MRYRELSQLGFPQRYPLVQFPNAPLWVAIAASVVGRFVDGTVQGYVSAVGTAGIMAWGAWELAEGVNLFRRVFGTVVLVNAVYWAVARVANLA